MKKILLQIQKFCLLVIGVIFPVISASAYTEFAEGYTWTYFLTNMGAEIFGTEPDYGTSYTPYYIPCIPAASPEPSGTVIVPSSLGGRPVTCIGENAFECCSNITAVVLPGSIAEIRGSAFQDCIGLSSINLPDNLKIIDDFAFSGCVNLKQVSLGNQLEIVGWRAFYSMSGLESVSIPASVTNIDYAAFNSGGLKSISVAAGNPCFTAVDGVLFDKSKDILKCYPSAKTSSSYSIPSGTKKVEWSAFAMCSRLQSITIPASVDSLEANPFVQCEGLMTLKVNSNNTRYKSVNNMVLSKDGNVIIAVPGGLSSVTIPSSATKIGSQSFECCLRLVSITIPDSITEIGYEAFGACTNLRSVVISKNVRNIDDGAFCFCCSLEELKLPSGLTSIGHEAFQACQKLKSVNLPDGLSEIGVAAFEGCISLQEITIPESVCEIGYLAFAGNTSLRTVRFMGEPPYDFMVDDESDAIFAGDPDDVVGIYLPKYATSWAAVIDANGRWNGLRMVMEGAAPLHAHTVTFDPNGGSVSPETRSVESGAAVGELPTPENGDLPFLGWFTEVVGGDSVSATTLVSADTTFYAHWGSSGGTAEWQYADDGRGGIVITGRENSIGNLVIPSQIDGKDVTSIGDFAFRYCSGLTSVAMPDSVTNIGSQAFADCTNLAYVTIGKGVADLGEFSWYYDTMGIDEYVFSGWSGLISITVNEDNAYYSSKNGMLLSRDGKTLIQGVNGDVVIPDGVTDIGGFAFLGCSGLTSVAIPNSVTNVMFGYGMMGWNYFSAFSDCDNLISISVGSDNAYYSSVNGMLLSNDGKVLVQGINGNVQIPDGVEVIEDCAFRGRSKLTSVEIPDSVTSIGYGAFELCQSLTEVTIPNAVTNIWGSAFAYSGLTNILIPDNVESIKNGTFEGCGSLTNVVIGNGATSIGWNAFGGCDELRSLKIGGAVVDISEAAFDSCGGLMEIMVDDRNSAYQSVNGLLLTKDGKQLIKGVGGDVVIPDSVTCIHNGAFWHCSGLTSVTIGNGITAIDDWTFENCISLTNVVVGSRVISIGSGSFAYCTNLASVIIPDSVMNVGMQAFEGCSDSLYDTTTLPGVIMVDGWVVGCVEDYTGELDLTGARGVGYSAFEGCVGLTSVVIPIGVNSVNDCAFLNCNNLMNVIIPNTVTSIGHSAFYGCTNLTSITIPDSVTSIGCGAFENCKGTSTTIIPGLTMTMVDGWVLKCSCEGMIDLSWARGICAGSFSECDTLTDVILPKTIRNIGDWTFENCSGLTSLVIPDDVTSIGYAAFARCKKLADITIPNGVTSIGEFAFCDCENLTSVIIPSNATIIGEFSFTGCDSLTSVTIPSSVTSIGYGAFADCKNLLLARVPRALEKMINDENVFSGCPEDLVIEYYDPETVYDIIVGMKTEIDTELVGYAAKGLPSGLTYNSKAGKVSGTAKKPGEYEVTFLKNGESDAVVKFVVREEEVSIGCIGLSDGSFVVGVAGSADGIPLEVTSETGVKSVSVKNLPPGMKYNAKSGRIVGAPTKAGEFNVAVAVTTKSGAKHTESITISVAASPDDVVGTFNGFVVAPDGEENAGTFQLTVSETGKLAAKVTTAAGTYSFSDVCWDSEDDGIYSAILETKKGDELSISIDTSAGWNTNQLSGVFAAYGKETLAVSARRNAFGKLWHFAATGDADSGWILSYAANAKAADLSVTLNADGSTRVAGKLGQLKVKASGYSDATGLAGGVIFADFAPVVSVKDGRTSAKCVLSLRTNLWFDRSNNHAEGIGTARLVK